VAFRLDNTPQWALLWINVETSFIWYLTKDTKRGASGEISKCEHGVKIFREGKHCSNIKELHQDFTRLSGQKGDRASV